MARRSCGARSSTKSVAELWKFRSGGFVKLLRLRCGCLVNVRPAVPIYMTRGAPVGHDSSVANIAQGAMQGQLPQSGWRLSSQGVEQFGRSEALVSLLNHQLSFPDH